MCNILSFWAKMHIGFLKKALICTNIQIVHTYVIICETVKMHVIPTFSSDNILVRILDNKNHCILFLKFNF